MALSDAWLAASAAWVGGSDEAIDLRGQLCGQLGRMEQQIVLALLQPELLDQEVEPVPFESVAVREQLIEGRGQRGMEIGPLYGAQADRQATGGGFEALLEGFDVGRVRDAQAAGQELSCQRGLRLERRKVAGTG